MQFPGKKRAHLRRRKNNRKTIVFFFRSASVIYAFTLLKLGIDNAMCVCVLVGQLLLSSRSLRSKIVY